MFDAAVSADGRTRENEADRFTATVLRQAYIPGRVTTNRDVLAELVQAGVAEQLNPGQQLVASVLYAAESARLRSKLLVASTLGQPTRVGWQRISGAFASSPASKGLGLASKG